MKKAKIRTIKCLFQRDKRLGEFMAQVIKSMSDLKKFLSHALKKH